MSKRTLVAEIYRQQIAPLGGLLDSGMTFTVPAVIGDIEIRHRKDVTQIWVKPSRGKKVLVGCALGGTLVDVPQDRV